jgi:hypothetical protein
LLLGLMLVRCQFRDLDSAAIIGDQGNPQAYCLNATNWIKCGGVQYCLNTTSWIKCGGVQL